MGKRLCEDHGAVLVVNDRHGGKPIDAGCGFVHLGQEDLGHRRCRRESARQGIRIGISTHDEAELDRALSLDPDYVALGPGVSDHSEENEVAPAGSWPAGEWKQRIGDLPLVAIGGMTVERTQGAFESGANVISVVTDITLNANPEGRVREWIAATR